MRWLAAWQKINKNYISSFKSKIDSDAPMIMNQLEIIKFKYSQIGDIF